MALVRSGICSAFRVSVDISEVINILVSRVETFFWISGFGLFSSSILWLPNFFIIFSFFAVSFNFPNRVSSSDPCVSFQLSTNSVNFCLQFLNSSIFFLLDLALFLSSFVSFSSISCSAILSHKPFLFPSLSLHRTSQRGRSLLFPSPYFVSSLVFGHFLLSNYHIPQIPSHSM